MSELFKVHMFLSIRVKPLALRTWFGFIEDMYQTDLEEERGWW